MIRFFVFGRNLPDWTVEDYHKTLLHDHAPLVRACDGFVRHCAGYVQNHVQTIAYLSGGASPVEEMTHFRNCSAFWFEDEAELAQAYRNDGYLETLRPDEKRFGNPAHRVALGGVTSRMVSHRPTRSAGMKLMVLHDDAHPLLAARFAEIDRGALRQETTLLTSVMDFARLRFVTGHRVPFPCLTELWFGTDGEIAAATETLLTLLDTRLVVARVVEHWVISPPHFT